MHLINRQAAIKACDNSTFAAEAKWVIEHLPSASQWIPVKMRRMTAEEQNHFEEYYGVIDNEFTEMFDCPMPDDGQDILITTPWGVSFDTCDHDGDGFALEGRGDWEDVIAWMPLPQPYKGE